MAKQSQYQIVVERDASRITMDIAQVVPALPAIADAPTQAQRAEDAAGEAERQAELSAAWAAGDLPPDPLDPTSKSAKTLVSEAAAAVGSIPSVMAPHIAKAQAWAESAESPDDEDEDAKSSKSWAGEAAASAGAAQAAANTAQGLAADFADLHALTEQDHFDNLGALAGLAGVADRVAYFTGSGEMGLTPLTSTARGLLDDPDAATMRGTLGLGPLASTSVAALANGGTGATTAAAARTNLGLGAVATDSVVPVSRGGTGATTASAARSNLGLGTAATATVTTSATDTTAGRLLTTGAGPDQAFRRGNILGTVSQSGGVPTGAVIERGSNANGEYVRFADGTQMCWGFIANAPISSGVNVFTINFAAAFANFDYSVTVNSVTPNPDTYLPISLGDFAASSVKLYIQRTSGSSAYARWAVMGRWY